MAQKLHDVYGYSYDNMKVLLGGWNAWKTANYPTDSSVAPTAPGGTGPLQPTTAPGGVIQLTAVPAAPAAPTKASNSPPAPVAPGGTPIP